MWRLSSLWLVWIMLLWAFLYTSFGGHEPLCLPSFLELTTAGVSLLIIQLPLFPLFNLHSVEQSE